MSSLINHSLFCFILLSSLLVKAQYQFDFPKENGTWDNSYSVVERINSNLWDFTEQMLRVTTNGDTLINQTYYKKLYRQSGFKYHNGFFKPLHVDTLGLIEYYGAIRMDSSKNVYYISDYSYNERYLYNMDFSEDSVEYDSILTNMGYKKIKTHEGWIIEGIGSAMSLTETEEPIGSTINLVCYKEGEKIIFSSVSFSGSNIDPCDLFEHDILMHESKEVVTQHQVIINTNEVKIHNISNSNVVLYDVEGTIIKDISNTTNNQLVIDISTIQNGVYILKLVNSNTVITKKFIH